jgi:hypothetical protein
MAAPEVALSPSPCSNHVAAAASFAEAPLVAISNNYNEIGAMI